METHSVCRRRNSHFNAGGVSFWRCQLGVLLGCLEGKSWQLCGGLWGALKRNLGSPGVWKSVPPVWYHRCQGGECRWGHIPDVEGGMFILMQVGCHSGGANWGCSWGALKGNRGSSVVVLGSLEEKSWQLWGLLVFYFPAPLNRF